MKYFREKNQLENYQQREQIKRLRQHAQFVAREVMNFWRNISKIAEDKETTRLEELRKHQLDFHENSSALSTSSFSEETDDEETIEREEENEADEYALHELEELQADREESIETVLKRHYGIDLSEDGSSSELNQPARQLNDLITIVQSFQPTGFILQTTSVQNPVPFLLKHSLRDYQHVGFYWLARFYDNKLNCILADETGLGKTIQTIALLAYLAGEKGNRGPHLLIVPSNAMLNWEIELKKWCPALKILIDYGSINEWTNVNAFHICVTSYQFLLRNVRFFPRNQWRYLILDSMTECSRFSITTLANINRITVRISFIVD